MAKNDPSSRLSGAEEITKLTDYFDNTINKMKESKPDLNVDEFKHMQAKWRAHMLEAAQEVKKAEQRGVNVKDMSLEDSRDIIQATHNVTRAVNPEHVDSYINDPEHYKKQWSTHMESQVAKLSSTTRDTLERYEHKQELAATKNMSPQELLARLDKKLENAAKEHPELEAIHKKITKGYDAEKGTYSGIKMNSETYMKLHDSITQIQQIDGRDAVRETEEMRQIVNKSLTLSRRISSHLEKRRSSNLADEEVPAAVKEAYEQRAARNDKLAEGLQFSANMENYRKNPPKEEVKPTVSTAKTVDEHNLDSYLQSHARKDQSKIDAGLAEHDQTLDKKLAVLSTSKAVIDKALELALSKALYKEDDLVRGKQYEQAKEKLSAAFDRALDAVHDNKAANITTEDIEKLAKVVNKVPNFLRRPEEKYSDNPEQAKASLDRRIDEVVEVVTQKLTKFGGLETEAKIEAPAASRTASKRISADSNLDDLLKELESFEISSAKATAPNTAAKTAPASAKKIDDFDPQSLAADIDRLLQTSRLESSNNSPRADRGNNFAASQNQGNNLNEPLPNAPKEEPLPPLPKEAKDPEAIAKKMQHSLSNNNVTNSPPPSTKPKNNTIER